MAIALTEKIRSKLGDKVMCVWEITGLVAGANNVSAESLGLSYVDIAEFRPMTVITSALATTPSAMMTTAKGTSVTITSLDSAETGTIVAYGT